MMNRQSSRLAINNLGKNKVALTSIFLFFALLVNLILLNPVAASEPQAVLLVAGDIATCNDLKPGKGAVQTAELLDKLVQENPGAQILALGDLVYMSGTKAEFESCYEPTWGRHKQRTLPVPGNHEYIPDTAFTKGFDIEPYNTWWKDRFDALPVHSGDPRDGFYRIDIGSWRLLGINSTVITDAHRDTKGLGQFLEGLIKDPQQVPVFNKKFKKAAEQMTSTYSVVAERQNRWLEQQAFKPQENNESQPCTLAFMHHPKFSSGVNNSVRQHDVEALEPLYETFYKNGVTMVLTGHDHQFEQLYPMDHQARHDFNHGMRSFVIGTGGAQPISFPNVHENSEMHNNSDLGVLKLELFKNSYTWQFITTTGKTEKKQSESCVPRN